MEGLCSRNFLWILNREERNLDKSRYRDVIPGEATRVKLLPDGDEKHDFINANYVSGHNNQERAYIFAQGTKNFLIR
jgi:protein tyrosine phosphatase